MYTVFGDESSDETGSRVFAVAGVLGNDGDWKSISETWPDRTGGKVFHATECETDQGEFKNNSHSENQALYKDLTQLVCKSNLAGRALAIMSMTPCFREMGLHLPSGVRRRTRKAKAGRSVCPMAPIR